MRRTPLQRRTPLAAKATLKARKSMTSRYRSTGPDRDVVDAVYERAGHCCELCTVAPPAPVMPVDRRPEWSVQAENATLLKERNQLLHNCAVLERRAREAERQSTAVLLGGVS